ncbi:glycosyltransferase family 1 protein [Magnetospirillum sp. 15-1]|uniref:glycosyltransferase family 1 protein n=1 Tax=Magnetospirillum sp. 15-1 TaxID=1979370 RepID=UPI001F5B6B38|nr:glycosyltransferase family 1 protein [Magnetospirillum sp. 15-1]
MTRAPMFAYLDPALMNNLGHHANSGRNIVREIRTRGIPCAILGHAEIEPGLQTELSAVPWFRWNTYTVVDRDPICGWLNDFEMGARVTAEDIGRLQGLHPKDLIYVNSVQPAQFMAVLRWGRTLPDSERPTVIMEFGTDPGLVLVESENAPPQFVSMDPRVDPRAVLLRFTGRQLTEADQRWLRLATFDSQSSAIFQMLLDYPVGTLPLPQGAVTTCRDRTGARPITIGILGHQRGDKGFHKVPALVTRLLAERNDIQVLVHNGWPEGMPEYQQALRDIAASDSRLVLNEQVADAVLWSRLLEHTDLMVCPYMRNRFVSSYSAVASEAMANAIPLVAPEGTTLHGVMREFGEPGTIFREESVEAIHGAVVAALDDFDRLAGQAKQASIRWGETRGAKCLVDTLLSWQAAS